MADKIEGGRRKVEGGIKAKRFYLHPPPFPIHPSSFTRLSRVHQIQGSTDEGTGVPPMAG
jgi:hypothetical protein